jgi:membrane fusion protein (multidrug efflux system)
MLRMILEMLFQTRPTADLRHRRSAPGGTLQLVPALAALMLLTSCGNDEAGGAGGRMRMPPVPVEVSQVRPETVRDGFSALGSIEAIESIEVVSEINAILEELPFTEGRPVQEGELLALLDSREIGAESRRAAALVKEAETNFRRAERLFAERAISEQEMERAETELEVAKANEAVSLARLEKTRIRAPFSGVVGRRRVSPGAYLRTGQVITELGRLDVMRVAFAAPERYASRLHRGMTVEIRTTAYLGETFVGRLTVVDPIIDPTSRNIHLVAEVPNPERKLKPGTSADITAVLAERERALVIPDEAVFAQGNQNFVFVVGPDSSVQRAPVQLGTRDSARVEVLGGLADGDRVVRAGHQKLFDGARVAPVPDESQTPASDSDESEAEVQGEAPPDA